MTATERPAKRHPRPAIAHGAAGQGVDTADGERRKLRALAAVGTRYGGEVLREQLVLVRLLLQRGTATIDDVRAVLGLPARCNARWLGAVAHGLRAAGLIRRAGFVETRRPEAHARPVSAWELVAVDAARAWLATVESAPRGGAPPPAQKQGPAAVAGSAGLRSKGNGEGTPVGDTVQLFLFECGGRA